jgi:hypothetical protein
MKIKMDIEIDATPEELRECAGLPNVSAVQDRFIAKMEEKMNGMVDAVDPMKVMGTNGLELTDLSKKWFDTWSDIFQGRMNK